MMKVIIWFTLITLALADYEPNNIVAWWDTDDNKETIMGAKQRTSFPKCLLSGRNSRYLDTSTLEKLFDKAFRDENYYSNNEHYENHKKNYDDVMDYDADEYRKDYRKTRIVPSVAIRLTKNIMSALACDLNGTDTTALNKFLAKFKMPGELCSFMDKIDCSGQTQYRTISGVCNNMDQPYLGSAQTAFARILPADYDDHISKPRRKAYYGGLLPSCRKVSLALGSKPKFDRSYNNFFVIFGQYIGHDIALSSPATDNYRTPISSCTCSSKHDWNKCTVIDIHPDDPYLGGQKCMAFPATAQAFQNEVCSLGVKEQMNGNTHVPDLSGLYGSTLRVSLALRTHDGKLKSTRKSWSKHEFPPAQRESKSCEDATQKRPCLAGGDSRLMVNLLFTGIQGIFLRFHNLVADLVKTKNPEADTNLIFETTRGFVIAVFQLVTYGHWIPTLFGPSYGDPFVQQILQNNYNSSVQPVVFNEVASAAFRCHTLVRDLFTRCTPDGHRIDQLWLHDISNKGKYVYDAEYGGLDSILCGSLYDYGFAHDGNFAHQIHNRLFESGTPYGGLWRNDLIAINICRGREHGIRGYNAYREHYGLSKAKYFEDFADTMNYDAIKLLGSVYGHVDDIDFFVGLHLEDAVAGGFVGELSAKILSEQFLNLCEGDRFCVAHLLQGITSDDFKRTAIYLLRLLFCKDVDIDEIPTNPFAPPDPDKNPMFSCTSLDTLQNILFPPIVQVGGLLGQGTIQKRSAEQAVSSSLAGKTPEEIVQYLAATLLSIQEPIAF